MISSAVLPFDGLKSFVPLSATGVRWTIRLETDALGSNRTALHPLMTPRDTGEQEAPSASDLQSFAAFLESSTKVV